MKEIDLFIGIKTEQTLRDAVRALAEESQDEQSLPELCPTGKKDWIAGKRLGTSVRFGNLEKEKQSVIKSLLALQSHQRIRHESIRLYSVRPPVPVFKDPMPQDLKEEAPEAPEEKQGVVTCSVCGVEVHSYNIQYDPLGRMVGCYLCRGQQSKKDGNTP